MTKNNQASWKIVNNGDNKKKSKKSEKKSLQNSLKIYENTSGVYTDERNSDEENHNLKKILCQNVIDHGECKYGNKCLYAHSLDEQNIDEKRRLIYELIDDDGDLSDFDLRKNYSTYKFLLELTKFCKNCNDGKCIGGYNCKAGACMKRYCICINDLNNNNCKNPACDFIHLTKRGLKPFYKKRIYSQEYDKNKKTTLYSRRNTDFDDNSDISDINTYDDDSDNERDADKENFSRINVSQIKDERYIMLFCDRSIFADA
jgi:hypothetical protein